MSSQLTPPPFTESGLESLLEAQRNLGWFDRILLWAGNVRWIRFWWPRCISCQDRLLPEERNTCLGCKADEGIRLIAEIEVMLGL